jgi:hypothetical protein
MVFRGRKLKATKRWEMNWENTEVVDKFNYLGMTLQRKCRRVE